MADKTVVKFIGRNRKEMIDPVHAQKIQEMIEGLELPERTKFDLSRLIDKDTATPSEWTFVMISPLQNKAVVDWLSENSTRPRQAVRLWSSLFTAMRSDTGEILMTRDELAEDVGCKPKHVSEIMGELTSINAISKRRVAVPGMRGPGMVHYYMNPNIGTHISGDAARQKARDEAGQLTIFDVIKGGKD